MSFEGSVSLLHCLWKWRVGPSHTGELVNPQAAPSLHLTLPAAPLTGHLHTQRIKVRKLSHVFTVSLIQVCSHTQYLLFFINYLLKEQQQQQQQTHLSLISTVSVLCLVLITEWEDMGIQGGLHCQNCRVRAGLVFINRKRSNLHILLAV